MNIKLIFCIICCGISYTSYGQLTAPYFSESRLIPPSPEAISLNQVGFSDVNLYTGKISYGIPIYTIEQNGFSFPITLAYIGGGGIKVEEVASSAGLGWSLNSTGVVSRVIRGLADDTYNAGTYVGYVHLPEIPNTMVDNYELFLSYARNKYDAQPDLYNISVAGISAQFYIGKDKKVIFLDKTEIRIDPVFSGYELIAFKMKDLNGRTYYFESKEQSKSIVHESAPAEYDDYATSSWYLTRVKSEYGKPILSFEYSTDFTQQVLRSPSQYTGHLDAPFVENNTTWNTVYTYKRTLNKIVFDLGEINFTKSDSVRYDLTGDKAIKEIVVKNLHSDTIKHYQLFHSYFFEGGVGPNGDSYRLKLDSLKEISSRQDQIQIYRFSYDTSHQLPNRIISFAMDHWGYYNGQNTNASWEAKNRVKYYRQTTPGYYGSLDSSLAEFGSANRNPSLAHTKAGVLTKVKTPTGGEVKFNYELNTSADSLLPNSMSAINFFSTLDFQPNYFHVQLINEPFGYVRVQSDVSYNTYSFKYELTDSLQTRVYIQDTLRYGDPIHIHKLEKGVYFIKVSLLGAHPDPSYNHFTRVYVENEIQLQNKFVGGLRIRSMEITDPVSGTNLVRNYYYNEAGNSGNSKSTGTISRVPSYGMQRIDMWMLDVFDPDFFTGYAYAIFPNNYYRTLSSAYPIGVTSGSYVGYGKVTAVDSNALKTESYFTSFKTFPEFSEGFFPNQNPGLDDLTINGKTYETAPFVPFDERDFLRGKLIRQIVFEKKDTVFRKLTDTENTYVFNMGYKTKDGNITVWYLPDTMQYLSGMVFITWPIEGEQDQPDIALKKFNLYTTHYALKKTVIKNYFYQPAADSLINETSYYYEDSPWFRDSLFHFLPTKAVTTTSKGKETIKNYYPYHWRYTIPESTAPDLTAYHTLDTLNRIGVPVVQLKEDSASASHLTTVKNSYSALVNGNLALNKISRKDGATALRDVVYFNQYDTLGNVLEQQKANDVKQSYLWGYNGVYPVAEVVNASHNEIFFDGFEESAGWEGSWMNFDNTRSHSGRFSGRIDNPSGTEMIVHSTKWLEVSLSNATEFTYSGWVYSNGPGVDLWFFMRTATEAGYYTHVDMIPTSTTGKWVYLEKKFMVPANITKLNIRVDNNGGGSVWYDDIRLHPSSAQMTTYTYDPLIGMTSHSDVNSRPTYYEYDGFGRLALIRDQDRNILKKICYNYAGQPEDCGAPVFGNTAKSGTFTRNNCGTNGLGGSVTYTVAANTHYAPSQAAADALAEAAVAAGGQAYANANGSCTWSNQPQTVNFTRNNCGTNGTGATIGYTVNAGSFTSSVSLADANQQAINYANANGQAYANANAGCTWVNQAQAGNFTKNNCGVNGTGSTVTYTINSGIYSSSASLADANQQAVDAVNAGGQAYANANGSCTWSNQPQTVYFTRNNCGTNGTGATIGYTVNAGSFTSSVSLADANQQAINYANANGQAYANANAGCTWANQAQSGNFTRNNCAAGGAGQTLAYIIAANSYTSTTSQADANQQAVDAVNAGGQAYANANGSCTWTSQQQTRWFTRNNCGPSQAGTWVLYTIPAGTHSSTVSQADANLLAYNASVTAGQAYANANGDCYCYCAAEEQRCVNDVCEIGIKVYTTSVYHPATNSWTCYYHYEYSDGFWSADYSEESYAPCYLP